MDLLDAIYCALDGNALLVTGAGFSYGATNYSNETLKTGEQLREALAKECNEAESTASLSTIASYFAELFSSEKLIAFLRNEFNVKSVSQWHAEIMSIKWKRVYTTNYDGVAEMAAKMSGHDLQPIIPSFSTQNYDQSKVCVHLNGYIDFLNVDSLNTDFKLIDQSYSLGTLEGQPWFEFMKSDLKSAKAIIVIGYSMSSDLDITRLLSSPEINEKTIFIDKPNADKIDIARLKKYGSYFGVGIENFAQRLVNTAHSYTPQLGEFLYNSFLHEHMTTLVNDNIGYTDIVDLFYRGCYKDSLCAKEHFGKYDGNYKYLVQRTSVSVVLKNLYGYKVFLAISDLGNGKSIFCHLIRNELRNMDIHVFTYQKELVDLDEEIYEICHIKNRRCVVIIDNYQSKMELLKRFSNFGIRNITFILTARKAVNIPNYRKLLSALNISEQEIKPIYLDRLNDQETGELSDILINQNILSNKIEENNQTGIKSYINDKCHSQFATLLLNLFNSSDIKQRIMENYKMISKNEEIKRVVIFALVKAVFNLDVDFTDILAILKLDYVLLAAKDNIFVNEFFNVSENDISIKSSIIAQELLYTVVSVTDVLTTLREIIISVDKVYKSTGKYKDLLRNMVSHTHFIPLMQNSGATNEVKQFYNSIRNTYFCSEINPFFWEQFAASCIDATDFVVANQCLSTAFVKAQEIAGFIPFQIETIKARCIIEELLYKSSFELIDSETAIQSLVDCHNRLFRYFDHPDNNIYHVFKIGIKYVEFFNYYKNTLDKRQQSIFIEKKTEMLNKMKNANEYYHIQDWICEIENCRFPKN